MIRPEDVADLQPGDVVDIRETYEGDEIHHTGAVRVEGVQLTLGGLVVRHADGTPASWLDSLTVVSRAPRPLYVNHPRTEPVPGDVANPGDGTSSVAFCTVSGWVWPNGTRALPGERGLRLLVDGETGQVVR